MNKSRWFLAHSKQDDDNDIDGQLQPQHQAIHGQHHQNIELFVEVLDGDGMSG